MIFFSIEGYDTFGEIQSFETTDDHTSDLIAMGPVVLRFFDLLDISFYDALSENWLNYYNSYASVFKMNFSVIALPGIGYYSFSIISWWFSLIFLSICSIVYRSNLQGLNQISPRYFLCFFIPWLITPFALPNDRETIGILFIGIIGMGFLCKEKLSFLSILTIISCCLALFTQRLAYAPFIPIILLLFAYNSFFVKRNIRLLPKIHFTNRLKFSLALIVFIGLAASISFILPVISFLAILDADFINRFAGAATGNTVTAATITTGIPLIDLPLKIFFLILTPFPFYQMYRGEFGWELNYVRLIPLNILPIFMFGKLYVTIFFFLELIRTNFTRLVFPIIGMLFISAVLVTDRSGAAYLIPGFACFILWMLAQGLSQLNFKKTLPYYFLILIGSHLLYWLVYWKI